MTVIKLCSLYGLCRGLWNHSFGRLHICWAYPHIRVRLINISDDQSWTFCHSGSHCMQEPRPDEPTHYLRSWPSKSMSMYVNVYFLYLYIHIGTHVYIYIYICYLLYIYTYQLYPYHTFLFVSGSSCGSSPQNQTVTRSFGQFEVGMGNVSVCPCRGA